MLDGQRGSRVALAFSNSPAQSCVTVTLYLRNREVSLASGKVFDANVIGACFNGFTDVCVVA